MRAVFVMVKCEMGRAYGVAQTAADDIAELSEIHSISGQYDLLAKFYLDTDQDVGRFVTEKVQKLAGAGRQLHQAAAQPAVRLHVLRLGHQRRQPGLDAPGSHARPGRHPA